MVIPSLVEDKAMHHYYTLILSSTLSTNFTSHTSPTAPRTSIQYEYTLPQQHSASIGLISIRPHFLKAGARKEGQACRRLSTQELEPRPAVSHPSSYGEDVPDTLQNPRTRANIV